MSRDDQAVGDATLLTPAEVAARLGVSPITVRSWVAKGWLRARTTPGGHRRFLWEDVERLLEERAGREAERRAVRVLVVDDDDQFRGFVTAALSVYADGVEVREAADGFQAGMALAEMQPDLVLLDYSMPGMNGAEVCRMIKANTGLAATRVVALTGYGDAAVERSLRAAGADEVLFKPVSIATIDAVLDRFGLRPAEAG